MRIGKVTRARSRATKNQTGPDKVVDRSDDPLLLATSPMDEQERRALARGAAVLLVRRHRLPLPEARDVLEALGLADRREEPLNDIQRAILAGWTIPDIARIHGVSNNVVARNRALLRAAGLDVPPGRPGAADGNPR